MTRLGIDHGMARHHPGRRPRHPDCHAFSLLELAGRRLSVAGGLRGALSIAHSPRRTGFTLMEAVVSTVIVAVMLVAALNTVGAARITQQRTALIARGRMLAESLMAEILQQSYQNPVEPHVFGLESGESGLTRSAYNDVDDYSGLTESPLGAKDGTTLPNSTNWKRTVVVEWVDPLNPNQVSGTETGAKRITVVASFRNVPQATVVAVKAAN